MPSIPAPGGLVNPVRGGQLGLDHKSRNDYQNDAPRKNNVGPASNVSQVSSTDETLALDTLTVNEWFPGYRVLEHGRGIASIQKRGNIL